MAFCALLAAIEDTSMAFWALLAAMRTHRWALGFVKETLDVWIPLISI